MKRKAYILGAGVSGLVTAWKLLERGWEVEIFEKEPFIAGMSRTWRWGDFLVDVGPHLFHTPDPQMAEFWESEFGDLFVKDDYRCCNVKGKNFDEYYPYPLSYESIAKYPKEVARRVITELEQANALDRTKARSYKEYIRALVGPTLQEMFFERYPKKVWGLSTDEMTPLWAPKRVELRQKDTAFYHGQWNAAGKFGTGCVYDEIQKRIVKLGGKIHLSEPVVGVTTKGHEILELKLKNGRNLSVGTQDVVISTIPINVMSQLLGFACPLTFRGIISVFIAINKEYAIPDKLHWLYYDAPELIFNRISEQKKLSRDTAVPGKTCVTLEIAYSKDDELDRQSDQALVDRALNDFLKTGLAKKEEILATSIHRQSAVYPLLRKDYQHDLANAQSRLGEYNQLYTIGTTGEFSYADSQILFQKAFDLVDILTNQYSDFSQVKRKQNVTKLNEVVELAGRAVGDGHKPFIIAEAGLNHNGSLEMALRLIDKAVEAGVDAVKFQTYQSANRISGKVKKMKYAETVIGTEETLLEMFQRHELKKEDHVHLFDYAKNKGILIFSTPFDEGSVELLESVGTPFYKLASFDLVNIPLLKKVASTKKPLILSTGMSTIGQIEEALEAVKSEGNANVILLHCVSSYPAAPESMNLRVIETLKKSFRVPVGFSDHTLGVTVSQLAMAIGANAIERHFTLDRMLEGPDHVFSSEPEEMKVLVRTAGQINQILGDGVKRIQPNEYDTINAQRKSLYAKVPIAKGQIIERDAIAIKGPGGGLQPVYLDIVAGRPARHAIEADFPITWEDI
ncbi:MAG: hypothetical protein KCHDKBKB_01136 [Elusimicrobia bacterium]|nr:hypothetical protein [Elusimicrobiota bacterium]